MKSWMMKANGVLEKLEGWLHRRLVIIGILAGVALIIYSNSFLAPMTLDDYSSIANNYSIRNPLDLLEIWKFYSNRVLLYFTLSLNYAIHDSYEPGYHIVNLLIHILNGIILYGSTLKLLDLNLYKGAPPVRYKRSLSLFTALLFISHPIQVNAVTYIIQRTAEMAATFYLLSIFYYLKFRMEGKWKYFTITMFFTVCAMFTKENTITIPFLLGLLELMFFMRDGRTTWKGRLLFLFILFLTVPIIPGTNLLLQGYSQSDPGVSFKASTDMDRFHYFFTQMNVIVLYIRRILLPVGLTFDYSNDFPLSKTLWENYSYVSMGVLSLIGLTGILKIRRNRLMALGILWFFIGLSVESSFISIKDVYFEHRLYFPLAGFMIFLLGLTLGFSRFIGRISPAVSNMQDAPEWSSDTSSLSEADSATMLHVGRRSLMPQWIFIVLSILLIPLYSILTLQRNYVFSDGIRLWTDVVQKAPGSDRAHTVLATNYLDAYEADNSRSGYLTLAEEGFLKAIDLNYGNDTAHCNLSKVYYLKKDYEASIEEAKTTLTMTASVYAYHNLGLSYKALGLMDDALNAFQAAYRLDNQCNFVLKSLGETYAQINDDANAIRYYEEFLKVNIYSDSDEVRERVADLRAR